MEAYTDLHLCYNRLSFYNIIPYMCIYVFSVILKMLFSYGVVVFFCFLKCVLLYNLTCVFVLRADILNKNNLIYNIVMVLLFQPSNRLSSRPV